jgi:hypothetical protein
MKFRNVEHHIRTLIVLRPDFIILYYVQIISNLRYQQLILRVIHWSQGSLIHHDRLQHIISRFLHRKVFSHSPYETENQ